MFGFTIGVDCMDRFTCMLNFNAFFCCHYFALGLVVSSFFFSFFIQFAFINSHLFVIVIWHLFVACVFYRLQFIRSCCKMFGRDIYLYNLGLNGVMWLIVWANEWVLYLFDRLYTTYIKYRYVSCLVLAELYIGDIVPFVYV